MRRGARDLAAGRAGAQGAGRACSGGQRQAHSTRSTRAASADRRAARCARLAPCPLSLPPAFPQLVSALWRAPVCSGRAPELARRHATQIDPPAPRAPAAPPRPCAPHRQRECCPLSDRRPPGAAMATQQHLARGPARPGGHGQPAMMGQGGMLVGYRQQSGPQLGGAVVAAPTGNVSGALDALKQQTREPPLRGPWRPRPCPRWCCSGAARWWMRGQRHGRRCGGRGRGHGAAPPRARAPRRPDFRTPL